MWGCGGKMTSDIIKEEKNKSFHQGVMIGIVISWLSLFIMAYIGLNWLGW